MRKAFTILAALFSTGCATVPSPSGRFDYFGQTPPGLTPQTFSYVGLGIDDQKPRIPVFSRDGRTLFFNMGTDSQIYIARKTADGWSSPIRAPFSDIARNWEPYLLPDQRTVLFGSIRPPGAAPYVSRVWSSRLDDDGTWSSPRIVVNTEEKTGIWYPGSTDGKELLFSAELPGGIGGSDLWRSDMNGQNRVPFPSGINSPSTEWDPHMLADGKTLLFASNRPGGHGNADLYVAFKGNGGEWSQPLNMGPLVNTSGNEVASAVSPDGKFIFFIREPGQLFWMSAQVLDSLRMLLSKQ